MSVRRAYILGAGAGAGSPRSQHCPVSHCIQAGHPLPLEPVPQVPPNQDSASDSQLHPSAAQGMRTGTCRTCGEQVAGWGPVKCIGTRCRAKCLEMSFPGRHCPSAGCVPGWGQEVRDGIRRGDVVTTLVLGTQGPFEGGLGPDTQDAPTHRVLTRKCWLLPVVL